MRKRYLVTVIAAGSCLAAASLCPAAPRSDNDKKADTAKIPSGADAAAWSLLRGAFDMRYSMPSDFSGLTATVTVVDENGAHTGELTYAKSGNVQLTLDGASDEGKTWTKEALGSIFGHRRAGTFAEGDGRWPITFTKAGDSALLGTQVQLNDGMHSMYRVRDNNISEVTREAGGMRFTITVLNTQSVGHSKTLPRDFTVNYFDANSDALKRSQTFEDVYAPVHGIWLIKSRKVTTAEDGKIMANELRLSDIKLMPAIPAAVK